MIKAIYKSSSSVRPYKIVADFIPKVGEFLQIEDFGDKGFVVEQVSNSTIALRHRSNMGCVSYIPLEID